jgi:hypothetical protein
LGDAKDAHHCARLLIDEQLTSESIWSGVKMLPPKEIGNDYDVVRTRPVFFRQKPAAKHRFDR